MTDAEVLLETCVHEAAHAALCIRHSHRISKVHIGATRVGGHVSAGYVSANCPAQSTLGNLAEIFSAGQAVDVLRRKFTFEEIFEAGEADLTTFKSTLMALGESEEDAVVLFGMGLKAVSDQLLSDDFLAQVTCLGESIFERLQDGLGEFDELDVLEMYQRCQ